MHIVLWRCKKKAINGLEVTLNSTKPNSDKVVVIDLETVKDSTQSKVIACMIMMAMHIMIYCAFQKSIRGNCLWSLQFII